MDAGKEESVSESRAAHQPKDLGADFAISSLRKIRLAKAAAYNCLDLMDALEKCAKDHPTWYGIPRLGHATPHCYKAKRQYDDCLKIQTDMLGVMGYTFGADKALDQHIQQKCVELFQNHK